LENLKDQEIYSTIYKLIELLPPYSATLNISPSPEIDRPQVRDDQSIIQFTLEQKHLTLSALLEDLLSKVLHTSDLEKSLLAYLDHNIIKVENHLLQIDFWQNHNLHKDVMHLRSQMQQQLFQLEQEKVRTQIQIDLPPKK
jgi:hypothetical protein